MVSNGTGNFLFPRNTSNAHLAGRNDFKPGMNNNNGFQKVNKKSKHNRFYDHCKEQGHVKDQCFKLHGYPDWYKPDSKGRRNFRLAANVISYGNNNISAEGSKFDTPLDISDSVSGSSQMDHNFVSALAQEIMKIMKGKQAMETQGTSGSHEVYANFRTIPLNTLWQLVRIG